MRFDLAAGAALAVAFTIGCSRSPQSAPATSATAPDPVRITQFYATAPRLALGEPERLCYGVENARTVWLSPPRQELSAALTRCVDVTPTANTTYTLTAEGKNGGTATQEVTVTLGARKARLVEVRVSSLEVKRGETVSICAVASNPKRLWIEPKVPSEGGCWLDQPLKTTTYTVSIEGADGDRDQERVTVKVH